MYLEPTILLYTFPRPFKKCALFLPRQAYFPLYRPNPHTPPYTPPSPSSFTLLPLALPQPEKKVIVSQIQILLCDSNLDITLEVNYTIN